jgi:O-antigen/teichoic acid export membrane protein
MTAGTETQSRTILQEIRTSVRHMAAYGAGSMLIKAMGFLMIPFYTHYLTPQSYGTLEILDLSMSLLNLILSMGLTPAFLRCYAAADTDAEKRRVVSTASIFGIVTGLGTFLLGAAAFRPASAFLFGPGVPAQYLLISFATLVLNYMGNLPRTYLRALERAGAYTAVDTVTLLIQLVLNIVFIAGFKMGLAGVLWSGLVVAGLQFVLVSAWAFWKAGVRFARPHMHYMLRFGFPLIFANSGLFILNFSDRFFLQRFQSLEVVGIYALGYKFGYMMHYLIVQPFFVMWQGRMYSIHKQPDHQTIFKQIFALYSIGLIYAGLAMSLFSPETVRVMAEPKFAASQNVIPVVVLSYIFYGLAYYAQLGLYLTDRTRAIGMIGMVSAGVNLALNYVLVRQFGMMGAAAATVLSFAVMAGISYWKSQRVFPMQLGIGRTAVAMTMAIAFFLACRWLSPEPFGMGLWLKAGVLLLFPAAIWKLRLLPAGAETTLVAAADRVREMFDRRFAGALPMNRL